MPVTPHKSAIRDESKRLGWQLRQQPAYSSILMTTKLRKKKRESLGADSVSVFPPPTGRARLAAPFRIFVVQPCVVRAPRRDHFAR